MIKSNSNSSSLTGNRSGAGTPESGRSSIENSQNRSRKNSGAGNDSGSDIEMETPNQPIMLLSNQNSNDDPQTKILKEKLQIVIGMKNDQKQEYQRLDKNKKKNNPCCSCSIL